MPVEKRPHGGVALSTGLSSQHHGDKMLIAAMHRGSQIESACVGVAGLDAVTALVAEEELIVIAILAAIEAEITRLEDLIIFRVVMDEVGSERRRVARRGDLVLIWKA